jgi:hypothetical protein
MEQLNAEDVRLHSNFVDSLLALNRIQDPVRRKTQACWIQRKPETATSIQYLINSQYWEEICGLITYPLYDNLDPSDIIESWRPLHMMSDVSSIPAFSIGLIPVSM